MLRASDRVLSAAWPRSGYSRDATAMIQPSLATALALMTARAAALPTGDVERHVQTCTWQLESSCVRRAEVRDAVDRLVAAVEMLQDGLRNGGRRRAQHELVAVERFLEVFQEELLPQLRREQLI
jgi:hypothetical protein